ncbi:MAG: lytic murein transglycosylase [Rhodobiaceae bacterium]|nr:lytic murein transglycosylase [Rhodobiaceae bacterium]MCC0055656.1 lytic murein transglycosylase [Rhodobiaceae bacterium]
MNRLVSAASLFFLLAVAPAQAATCGGDFNQWLNGVFQEARAAGVSDRAIRTATPQMVYDKKIISRDRAQGVFAQTFLEFSGRMVSSYRLKTGGGNLQKYANIFRAVEQKYGVPGPVITAFWALETDFGAVQGDFQTFTALTTLSYDCRRPELFRPQLIAALKLLDHGDLPISDFVGAWAGEIGQTQILPKDYIAYGIDFDGDGKVDLKRSTPDVIATAGHFIQGLGWRRGEPWLEEVQVPANMNWEEARLDNKLSRADWAARGVRRADGGALTKDGLPASLLLPMGHSGPAFLAYPNFDVYLEWNKSLVYCTTAAYLATRLAGASKVSSGANPPGLSLNEMKALQRALQARGYHVGDVDGILGENTRAAVRQEQKRLGLPADGWPTQTLVSGL